MVVVVHGLGDHGRALPYRFLAAALVPHGCLVISFDQRGHGASGSPAEVARLPLLQDDLRTVAGHSRSLAPGIPLVVVGLSMGAIVSVLEGRATTGLCDGIVAASAPLGPLVAGRLAVLTATALGRILPALAINTGIDMSAVTDNPADLAAYVGDPLFRTKVPLGLAADLLAAAPRLRSAAPQLPMPSLFLHGARDRLAPWGAELASSLHGPARTVAVFQNGCHNLFLDLGRAEVFEAIIEWLPGIRGGEGPRPPTA